ncbi:MAG: hydroxysqualene dehydroxylase, partial [Gemmataceae bacterium]
EMLASLGRLGVEVRFNAAVRRFVIDGRVRGVELRDGTAIDAETVVSAVPWHRLLTMLPADVIDAHPAFANLRRLEASPITSVHLWTDRRLTELPHVVLIGCVGQWLFARPGNYLQVVVSASRGLRALGGDETRRRVVEELTRLFGPFEVARSRVVTEAAATFSAVPGVDGWRPGQRSPVPGLLLAGDWTRTGWPATMEGAVRSGYLAAGEVVGRRLVRAELR